MDNQETSNLEDNLPMVSYIMLHRIYDMLTLIADIMAKNDDDRQKISKMVEYHKEGFLLGPAPSYNSGENNE
jgi:hypothetical protein